MRVSSLLEGRNTLSQPSQGNALDLTISDSERAGRIAGRTLVYQNLVFGEMFDVRYRVDHFRRFLPRRGESGNGLLQFWGVKATRRYAPGTDKGAWQIGRDGMLHTVEITMDLSVKGDRRVVNQKPKKHVVRRRRSQ